MSRSMLLSVDELLTITLSLQYSIDCPMPRSDTLPRQRLHLIGLHPGSGLSPLVFPFLLRRGDPDSLALQHQASLELRDGREHARAD